MERKIIQIMPIPFQMWCLWKCTDDGVTDKGFYPIVAIGLYNDGTATLMDMDDSGSVSEIMSIHEGIVSSQKEVDDFLKA